MNRRNRKYLRSRDQQQPHDIYAQSLLLGFCKGPRPGIKFLFPIETIHFFQKTSLSSAHSTPCDPSFSCIRERIRALFCAVSQYAVLLSHTEGVVRVFEYRIALITCLVSLHEAGQQLLR